MGGGDTTVQTPPPPVAPSAGETTQEAMDAQINSLPQMLAAQQEFGPQFSQVQLEQLQQFGPQFAQQLLDLQNEFGPQIGASLRAEQEAANPELGAARTALTDYLNQPDELSDAEKRLAQEDIRGAQNVRGFALESGVGAENELEGLTRLRQDLKTRRLNIALSTSGRAPVTGASQGGNQQGSFGPGQLVQNVSPGQIFGLAQSSFQTGANIFGTQMQGGIASLNAATARRGQNAQVLGSAIS